jgi:hypothetical protein
VTSRVVGYQPQRLRDAGFTSSCGTPRFCFDVEARASVRRTGAPRIMDFQRRHLVRHHWLPCAAGNVFTHETCVISRFSDAYEMDWFVA